MHARPMYLSIALAVGASALAGLSQASAHGGDPPPDRNAGAPTAGAFAVGKPWTTVADVNLGIDQPDVIRDGDRLHVIWSRQDGSVKSVRTRLLTSDGALASPTRPVVTTWVAVIGDPKLLDVGDDMFAVFAGIRSFAPGDPYVGPAVHSSSPDGLDWTLEPGSLSQTTAAGNAQSVDLIQAQGEPLFAMGGFGRHLIMHRGVSGSSPASTPDFFTTDSACCPATWVALANDTATDRTWGAWFALGATDPDDAGIFAQKVWPRPNGTLVRAPGSAGTGNPGLPVALASRTGGGVWLAYQVGATGNRIRLWQVGTQESFDFKVGSFTTLAMTTGPGGRLWLAWRKPGDGTLQATRTNRAVTRVGVIRTLPQPGGTLGQLNNMALEGSRGPLIIVAGSQPPGSGSNGVYATRVLPGLTVKVSPRRLARGLVRVTVTDAGDPVRGARVRLRGSSELTNAAGRASFTIGRRVPAGRYGVTATKADYARSTALLRVT